ncbi:hypothetical protein [Haloarcula salina]|uniref:Uncharacterized protein n=1 Tax=Haloarcula salina TaxID=1429914 RepID=A0AA41G3A2_9EURY|nr:hypothetical protein [Haloarcula salina]MBV0902854.1 hypothetical protein [Haloarcula salina]
MFPVDARFRQLSAPLSVAAVVAGALLVVPPLVLGELTARAYLLTTAPVIIAIASATPYAVLVGVGTLPVLYAGLGSYASPRGIPRGGERPDLGTALRHATAGVGYALAAAILGAVGIGIDMASPAVASVPTALEPSFFHLGGVVVGALYVGCQLWRYDAAVRQPDPRVIGATVVLGGLLAVSPAVALWVFGGGGL